MLSIRVSAGVGAVELLKDLPHQAVTFETILGYALKSSTFKTVVSGYNLPRATRLKTKASFDWRIVARAQSLRELIKPQSILTPEEINTQTMSLGFNKSFSTGTLITLDWLTRKAESNFNSLSEGNSIFGTMLQDRTEYSPELGFTVKQEMWRNSFGSASRANLRVGELQEKILEIQFREGIKGWYYDLLKAFYGAWLAQQNLHQANEDLKRQQRLFRVSKARYERGNTELADYLQIKVGLNLAEQRQIAARSRLTRLWGEIVVQLELPSRWLELDPLELPVVLDEPMTLARSHCQSGWQESENYQIQLAQLEKASAENQLVAAKSRMLPDVSLFASLKRSGRNVSTTEATREVSQGRYPSTTVGVQLDWNLEVSAERAQALEAAMAMKKAEAQTVVKRGSYQASWVSDCDNFKRLEVAYQQLEVALSDQIQRLDLEEKRFREGRSHLFQVIQAQVDLQSIQALASQNATELRTQAWETIKQGREINLKLDQLLVTLVLPEGLE
jgi:outer membrane protein TolC